MLQVEHSAILLTFINLSIFEWPFYTGFTVRCQLQAFYRVVMADTHVIRRNHFNWNCMVHLITMIVTGATLAWFNKHFNPLHVYPALQN